jgi:hypothetical protein
VEPDPTDLIHHEQTNRELLRQLQRNKENKAKFWIQNSGFKIMWMTRFSQKSQALVLPNRPGTSLNQPTKAYGRVKTVKLADLEDAIRHV